MQKRGNMKHGKEFLILTPRLFCRRRAGEGRRYHVQGCVQVGAWGERTYIYSAIHLIFVDGAYHRYKDLNHNVDGNRLNIKVTRPLILCQRKQLSVADRTGR